MKKIKEVIWPILRLIFIAMAINSLLEILNKRTITGLIRFASENTIYFWLNTLIIMLTISVSGVFKKRYMLEFLVIFTWVAIGVSNFIMLNFFRTAPMTAMDLKVIKNAILLLPNYFTELQIFWIVVGFLLLGFVLFTITKNLSLRHISVSQRKRSVINVIMVSAFLGVLTIIPLYSEETSEPSDIVENYENYGFTYCFTGSLIDQGIEKPESYSKKRVIKAWEAMEQEKQVNIKPNIIMVQLESVFNVDRLIQKEHDEQPMKNYINLMDNYSSGF